MGRLIAGLILAPVTGIVAALIAAVGLTLQAPDFVGVGLLWRSAFATTLAVPTTCLVLPLVSLYAERHFALRNSSLWLLPAVGLASGFFTTVILLIPAFVIAGSLAGALAGFLFEPVRALVLRRRIEPRPDWIARAP